MNTNTNAASVPGPEDQKFNAWYESKFKPAMERGPFDKYVARQAWFAALSTAAQPPVPKEPLSEETLKRMHHEDQFGLFCDYEDFEQITRAIEQAHGITTGKKQE